MNQFNLSPQNQNNYWVRDDLKKIDQSIVKINKSQIETLLMVSEKFPLDERRTLSLSDKELNEIGLSELISKVKNKLDNQNGFIVLRYDKDYPEFSDDETKTKLFWTVGNLIATPIYQNKKGELLYSVENLGISMSEGGRYSKSSDSGSFHSDAPFNIDVPDYVGLLCLRPAVKGGESCIVNMFAVYEYLKNNNKEVLETLASCFYFDRRGEHKEGEPARIFEPIFKTENRFQFRYLRDYIEQGHQNEGVSLDPKQIAAMDVLDELLEKEEFRVVFPLLKGDLFYFNNFFLAHGRNSFEDSSDEKLKRFFYRLWLTNDVDQ